ncbi:MAG: hypothetical protein WDL87_05915 [Candidatus Omnitrophota bacterium]
MNSKRGSLLLQLLISIAIIAWLSSILINKYFLKPSLNQKEVKTLQEDGIDATGYNSLVNTSQEKIHKATERMSSKAQEIDAMLK